MMRVVGRENDDVARDGLGLLCSARCPGGLVLKLYDLARLLRDEQVHVVGGFQTPMEQEALRFLLRGRQKVTWVPSWHRSARGLPEDARLAHEEGRLVLENIFPETAKRPSRARGRERNLWVVDHCRALVVVHAAEGGDTANALAHALERKVPVAVVADPANESLLLGQQAVDVVEVEAAANWFTERNPLS